MSNDNLQPLPPSGGLRDYTHASKTFGVKGGSYNLVPRNKFLFHVYFNLNMNIPAVKNLVGEDKSSIIGLMVKTAQLPSYQIDVGTMNQYNRKRLIQTKINYNPCQIVFNDDSSDFIRNMWYQYYQYYYSDPTYKYGNTPAQSGTLGEISGLPSGFSYGANDTYTPSRAVQHWGLSGQGYNNPTLQTLASSLLMGPASGVEPFFKDISIYGLAQKSYAQYTMINPLITEWTHDTYDYSQGSQVVTHTMSIRYEAVKYYSGDIGGYHPSEQVPGFAQAPSHYDGDISPIARPGSNNLPGGPGGNKQDLQANSQGGLKNVLGAVGQSLVPAASAFAGAQLVGSGAYTQNILDNLAPAIAASVPQAAQATWNIPLGPRPAATEQDNQTPITASYNADGTVNAADANAYGEG